MFENMSLNCKILWARYQVRANKNSLDYWTNVENDLRKKYAGSNKAYEHKHIHAIKKHRKEAAAELKYWTDVLKQFESQAA